MWVEKQKETPEETHWEAYGRGQKPRHCEQQNLQDEMSTIVPWRSSEKHVVTLKYDFDLWLLKDEEESTTNPTRHGRRISCEDVVRVSMQLSMDSSSYLRNHATLHQSLYSLWLYSE